MTFLGYWEQKLLLTTLSKKKGASAAAEELRPRGEENHATQGGHTRTYLNNVGITGTRFSSWAAKQREVYCGKEAERSDR
jgi:hypothetical protein